MPMSLAMGQTALAVVVPKSIAGLYAPHLSAGADGGPMTEGKTWESEFVRGIPENFSGSLSFSL